MNLSKKMRMALIIVAVFASTFLAVFSVISSTQSAYSTPNTFLSDDKGMDVTIGPKPNATDVPLDTTITIDALSSATLDDLNTTPEISISNIAVEVSGPLSYKQTFYPAQLLKPATSYTISVVVRDTPVSWSFTTTSEPYQPTMSFYLATYASWIALAIATTITSLAGSAIWLKEKRRPPDT